MEKLILEIRNGKEEMSVMERRLLCQLVGRYANATRIGVSAWDVEDLLLESEHSTSLLGHLRKVLESLSDVAEELKK